MSATRRQAPRRAVVAALTAAVCAGAAASRSLGDDAEPEREVIRVDAAGFGGIPGAFLWCRWASSSNCVSGSVVNADSQARVLAFLAPLRPDMMVTVSGGGLPAALEATVRDTEIRLDCRDDPRPRYRQWECLATLATRVEDGVRIWSLSWRDSIRPLALRCDAGSGDGSTVRARVVDTARWVTSATRDDDALCVLFRPDVEGYVAVFPEERAPVVLDRERLQEVADRTPGVTGAAEWTVRPADRADRADREFSLRYGYDVGSDERETLLVPGRYEASRGEGESLQTQNIVVRDRVIVCLPE